VIGKETGKKTSNGEKQASNSNEPFKVIVSFWSVFHAKAPAIS